MGTTKEDKINLYYPMLYRYVVIRLENETEAMDIVQETLFKYLQTQTEFEDDNKEKAWLFTVASNLCKNYWRSSWYKRVIPISDDVDILNVLTPESIIETGERNKILLKAVLRLPAKYREVVHLFYYEGMRIEEISQITGRNKSTIQTQLERARKILRKELETEL